MSAHAADPTNSHPKISGLPAWAIAAGFRSGYTAVAHEALQAVIADKKLPLSERVLAWLQRNAWGNSSAYAIRFRGPALRLTDCAFDLSSPRGPISRAFKQLELEGYARREKDGRLYPNPNPAPSPKSSSPTSDRVFFEALRKSDPAIYAQWKEELTLRNQAQNRYRINTKKLRKQADSGGSIIIDVRTIELKKVCGRAGASTTIPESAPEPDTTTPARPPSVSGVLARPVEEPAAVSQLSLQLRDYLSEKFTERLRKPPDDSLLNSLIEILKNRGASFEHFKSAVDFRDARHRDPIHSYGLLLHIATECSTATPGAPPRSSTATAAHSFVDDLRNYLRTNAEVVGTAGFNEVAEKLRELAADAERHSDAPEGLDAHLTQLEEDLVCFLRSRVDEADMRQIRLRVESKVKPYRGRMSAEQLAEYEKRQVERELLEHFNLPRLGIYYMR